MGKYKVKVNIELVECNNAEEHNPLKEKEGSFTMTTSEQNAISIDNCERAVLRTAYPTIRDAVSRHLSEISKKKAVEKAKSGKVTVNTQPYKVDGEVGRFEFTTHSVSPGDEILYNTGQDLFAELKAKELYRTIGFKEIAMIYGDTEESYRKTNSLVNRIRYQAEGGTPYRTVQENTEQEGRKLIEYVERTSKCILQQNGFSEDGVYLGHKVPAAENQAVRLSNEIVSNTVEKCTGDPLAVMKFSTIRCL